MSPMSARERERQRERDGDRESSALPSSWSARSPLRPPASYSTDHDPFRRVPIVCIGMGWSAAGGRHVPSARVGIESNRIESPRHPPPPGQSSLAFIRSHSFVSFDVRIVSWRAHVRQEAGRRLGYLTGPSQFVASRRTATSLHTHPIHHPPSPLLGSAPHVDSVASSSSLSTPT
jgi:hypothetical protein